MQVFLMSDIAATKFPQFLINQRKLPTIYNYNPQYRCIYKYHYSF